MRVFCFIIFAFVHFSVCGADFQILSVGQASCNIIKHGENCIVFDCGSSEKIWLRDLRKKISLQNMVSNLFEGVNSVTFFISHNHQDHYNQLKYLKPYLKRQGFKVKEIKSWEYGLDELKRELGNALGDEVEVEVFRACVSPISDEDGKNHDNCAVMKVSIGGHGFLFTGDASGAALRGMFGHDTSVIDGVCAMIMSHHGSDEENALLWYQKVIERATQPVLCIISSDPRGQSRIPSFSVVKNLLQEYQCGRAYCAYHHLEGFEGPCFDQSVDEAIIEVPACYPNGLLLPVFITSKAKENGGDGVYRVNISAAGNIFMTNSKISHECQFILTPAISDLSFPELNMYQYLVGKMICEKVIQQLEQEIAGLREKQEARTLADARADEHLSAIEYLGQSVYLHPLLQHQMKRERYWRLRSEIVCQFLESELFEELTGNAILSDYFQFTTRLERFRYLISSLLHIQTEKDNRLKGVVPFPQYAIDHFDRIIGFLIHLIKHHSVDTGYNPSVIYQHTIDEIRTIIGEIDPGVEEYLRGVGIIR